MNQVAPATTAPTGRANTYGHFKTPGVGWDFYDKICRKIGFPRAIDPDMLGTFAGSYDGGWEVIDLWSGDEAMERVFSNLLVDSISSTIAEADRRPDVEPELRRIGRLVVGPSAADFHEADPDGGEDSLARRGLEPIGAVIESLGGDESDYMAGCAKLGFPRSIPDGMVLHVAGPCSDGWRVFDCFDSRERYETWHREVAAVISSIDAEAGRDKTFKYRELDLKRVIVSPRLTGGGYLPAS